MARIIKVSPSHLPPRRFLIIAFTMGVVLSVLVVSWFIYSRFFAKQAGIDDLKNTAITEQEQVRKAAKTSTAVYLSLEKAIATGDVAAIENSYDESIAKVTEPLEKATLYYSKANALAVAGASSKSLEAALEADKLDKNHNLGVGNDALIANTAYELGKKDMALQYYKKLHDFMVSRPMNDGDMSDIEKRIKELESV